MYALEKDGFLGAHCLAELHGCDPARIDDAAFIERMMTEAAEMAGARVIAPLFHRFAPQGVSGVLVIAESHFAIHTWPEHAYAALDLFSCAAFDWRAALRHVARGVGARRHAVTMLQRGTPPARGGPFPPGWEEEG